MSKDWLDNFQMMGAFLNEGEKSLMRFAMLKERERIIKLLDENHLTAASELIEQEAPTKKGKTKCS
jgi:hypothetical protein